MCFILCCCCNLCNKYSSKCIEITILILLIFSFLVSLIGLFFVNKNHSSIEGFSCLLVVSSLSIILISSIILIIIWRYKSIINNKRNKAASIFSTIGLILTIFCILFTGLWENLSITNFSVLNNPCKSNENKVLTSESQANILLILRRNLLDYEENKGEFCKENHNYNAHIIPIFEYIFVFSCSSFLEIIFLVLLYFWYNDFRRIKFLVEGKLHGSKTIESSVKYTIKKNFNDHVNHIIYGQSDYDVHYDIYGRPIFNVRKSKSKIVNINNKQQNPKINIHYSKTMAQKKINNNNEYNINYIDKAKIDFKKINTSKNNNDKINIFNLNFSKNKRKINISNINLSKSSNILNANEYCSHNKDISSIA